MPRPATSMSLVLLLLAGCAMEGGDPSESAGALVVTDRCEMEGTGGLPEGDFFAGRARGGDLGATGSWLHTGDDRVVLGTPTLIFCRINGVVIGDVDGPASLDGREGYTFRVSVQDFGDPQDEPALLPGTTEVQTVSATKTYCPDAWVDGSVAIAERALVTVPDELPVTTGNAGNGSAQVTFELNEGGRVTCRYRGGASTSDPCTDEDLQAGLSYRFRRCTDEDGATLDVGPGDRLDVVSAVVHVQDGVEVLPSWRHPETTVSVDFEVTPLTWGVPERDYYRIAVWDDATGERVYFRDGNLTSGNVTIRQLDP